MQMTTIQTLSLKKIRITPHAMSLSLEGVWHRGPSDDMLSLVAAKVEAGAVSVTGIPVAFNFTYEEREIGDPDGMSAIMDWVRYITHTYTVYVIRLSENPEIFLLTTFKLEQSDYGKWGYEENDGYEIWEARQIEMAECPE